MKREPVSGRCIVPGCNHTKKTPGMRFCSPHYRRHWRRKRYPNRPAPGKHGHNPKGADCARWNHGTLYSSHGYILNRVTNDPRAFGSKKQYRYEHDLVMEKHLGRKLQDNEVVHHINGNTKDNRIENLELRTTHEHICLHDQGRARDLMGRFTSKQWAIDVQSFFDIMNNPKEGLQC